MERDSDKSGLYFGIKSIWAQDQAVKENMEPIFDRTREHLGSSDLGFTRVRRQLVDAALALRGQGITPPCVDAEAAYQVGSVYVVSPRETP